MQVPNSMNGLGVIACPGSVWMGLDIGRLEMVSGGLKEEGYLSWASEGYIGVYERTKER